MAASTCAFNTPTKRAKLKPGREPYWNKISKGRYIGYRKGQSGGSWVARLVKKSYSLPGSADLDYDEALKLVVQWIETEESGVDSRYTLRQCLKDYIAHLSISNSPKTAGETDARLRKHLTDKLLDQEVGKLSTQVLERWRNSMVPTDADSETIRKKKDSANRVWSMLRAALNKAYKSGAVDSNKAWARVESFKAVGARRELFLTDEQIAHLLDKTSGPFGDLCRAAILTGARLGELTAARVKDLDLEQGTIHLSGKTGSRDAYLSRAGLDFFKALSKDKLPEAPMLISPSGGHWKKGEHIREIQATVRKAKLPRDTVFYSLRHYNISKSVRAGISLLAIARNTGTSVAMIEKHYGKFQPTDFARLLDQVELGGVQ